MLVSFFGGGRAPLDVLHPDEPRHRLPSACLPVHVSLDVALEAIFPRIAVDHQKVGAEPRDGHHGDLILPLLHVAPSLRGTPEARAEPLDVEHALPGEELPHLLRRLQDAELPSLQGAVRGRRGGHVDGAEHDGCPAARGLGPAAAQCLHHHGVAHPAGLLDMASLLRDRAARAAAVEEAVLRIGTAALAHTELPAHLLAEARARHRQRGPQQRLAKERAPDAEAEVDGESHPEGHEAAEVDRVGPPDRRAAARPEADLGLVEAVAEPILPLA
mmetsp:Transcript_70321/g.190127  ORF Transcript_70321/g.190127 Transcript_70321/m.190127 type:complete len:273 (+) Transcript_70321:784-1602(+)